MRDFLPVSKRNFLQRIESILSADYADISSQVGKNSNAFSDKTAFRRPIFARNVTIGQNIYNTPLTADFLLYAPVLNPTKLVIRCFWQEQAGSAERKRPFDVLSIQRSDYQTIIIIEGGGFSRGAEKWLRDQQGSRNLLKVLNFRQFQQYYSSDLACEANWD